RTVTVSVAAGPPLMALDTPSPLQLVSRSFLIAGWAFDPAAASGSGVDAIHVWAFPAAGGRALFLGTGTRRGSRPGLAPAVRAAANTGFAAIATLPPGTWDVAVYAHSAVTGTFNDALSVRVVVQ